MSLSGLLAGLAMGLQPAPAEVPSAALPEMIAPLRFEMVIGAGPDGRQICQMAFNGEADTSGLLCGIFEGMGRDEMFASMPPDVAIVASVTVALDDDAVPPRSLVDRGELMFEGSARIDVDRSGRISNCQALGSHLRGPMAGMQGAADAEMPQLCEMPGLRSDISFSASPDGPVARPGLLRMELYIRVGISRTTA